MGNEDALKNKKDKGEQEKEKKKQDKYANMSEEEKMETINKKKCEELKAQGNEHFKKKEFEQAMGYYNQAIEIYPKELSVYLNRAGINHENKEYKKVIEDCEYVIDNTFDFQKRGRAYGRMGFAYEEMEDFDNAIESFNKSLLKNNDHRIKEALKKLQKRKEQIEAERYINPEIAEENN